MSTILKTLRKLEEDKNALDQKLDLKGMILKEDVTSEKSIKSDRRKFFLLIAMVTGLLIAGVVFYHWAPNYETPSSPKHVLNKTQTQQTIPFKDSSRPRAFEGVPMTAISSNELVSKAEPNKSLPSKPFTELLPEETTPVSTSSDTEEIKKFMRSTVALTKKQPTLPRTIQSGHIPGIKIKGVIFFDKDSSFNHIIATTENNSNLKLRVGETVQGAVLKSIHPNYVLFFHDNQLIEVGIGR
ncbi:MAG TPA: hypothetical protein EYN05_09895 [Nitrospinaceae bacterium]|jgi:hypothetical protein|nr:hypothetical protein [Nitrospinaceae bacterium]